MMSTLRRCARGRAAFRAGAGSSARLSKLSAAAIVIGMIAPAGPACADEVIWNSFGTGYASAVWSGDAIFGSAAEGPAYTANGFVPSTNYDITQIDLGLTYVHSTDANITLELVTDDGGVPSITAPEPVGGDVLESWTITDIPGPQVRQCTPVAHCTEPSAYPPVTVTSVPGVEVLAGDTYWLVAFPEDADTSVAWNDALAYTFGADAPIAFDFDNGGWSAVTGFEEQSAFDVLGTPVVLNAPEPSSLLLFVLGLLSLCVVHRLRSARA